MALPAFWLRSTIRRRWTSYLVVAALIAVMGGLALFALAGARRTQSSYPRFLRSVSASTMALDTGSYDPERVAEIAALPQVERSQVYVGTAMAPLVDGRPDFSGSFETLASVDGRFFEQDRFTPTSGRLPDPREEGEIAINEAAADALGLRVGQTLTFATFDPADFAEDFYENPPEPVLRTRVTIVGVGVFPNEVIQDDTDRLPLILLTPAYTAKALPYALYEWQGLELRRGNADVAAVERRVRDIVGDDFLLFRQTAAGTFHTQQAVRPLSISLAVFGVIAFVAAVVLAGQVLARRIQMDRDDRAVLRALGATPWDSTRAAALGPLTAVVGGVLGAVVVAWLASPLAPIGKVRSVEVDRGWSSDWTVLALGALVLGLALAAFVVVMARRTAPRAGDAEARRRAHPSRLVGAAAAAGLGTAATAGIRLAVEPGRGRTAVPVRSVIGGVAVAVAALVAAVTFAASLHRLVDQPRLFGWDWDATIFVGSGYGEVQPDAVDAVLSENPDVVAWSGARFGSGSLDGHVVPVLGVTPDAEVHPTITAGRMLRSGREIVLGARTLADLGKDIGDEVAFSDGGSTRRLRVVGVASLPTIGLVHATYPSLGLGALVDRTALGGTGAGAVDTTGSNVLFVRLVDGAQDSAGSRERLARQALEFSGNGDDDVPELVDVQRPAEIVNADDVGFAPTAMAIALAGAALAALGVALGTSVRRRRFDLALLKTLGFTRRQVGATVCWQASVTVVIGIAFGVPIGVVLGRFLWHRFANALDVVPDPTTPWAVIAAVAVTAVVVALAAAALPARVARRTPPAVVLRGE